MTSKDEDILGFLQTLCAIFDQNMYTASSSNIKIFWKTSYLYVSSILPALVTLANNQNFVKSQEQLIFILFERTSSDSIRMLSAVSLVGRNK